ncbi:MAG: hypothetical protein ACLFR0_00505 [Alphaproteobacteria bacterium]
MKKEISKTRKNFRRSLLGLALVSFAFFVTVVTLRVNKEAHWYVVKNYSENLFTLDIWQNKTLALLGDEQEKHNIAVKLINYSVFSNQYAEAGMDMMKDLADEGHHPSQLVYGNVLLLRPNLENQQQARHYYELAAAENYAPAIEKLQAFRN